MEPVSTLHPTGAARLSGIRYTPYYFKNSKGRCFAAKIVEAQSATPRCNICMEERLSTISVCQTDPQHIVCEVCEPQITGLEYNKRKACPFCGNDDSLLSQQDITRQKRQNQLSLGRTESECLTCHKTMHYSETPDHADCQPGSAAESQANIPAITKNASDLPLGQVRRACLEKLDLNRDGFDLKRIISQLDRKQLFDLRNKLKIGSVETETAHQIARDMITGAGLPVGYPYSWHSLACIFDREGYGGLAENIRSEHPVGGRAQRDETLASTDQPIDFHEVGKYISDLPQEDLQELGRALGLPFHFIETISWQDLVRKWVVQDAHVTQKGKPSWNRLANALKNIDQTRLMNRVIQNHPLDPADKPDSSPDASMDDAPSLKRMDFPLRASTSILSEADLPICKRMLRDLGSDIKALGTCLGVPESITSTGRYNDILWSWLMEEGRASEVGSCCWNTMANALYALDKKRIAENITATYPYQKTEAVVHTAEKYWENLDKPLTLGDAGGLIRVLRNFPNNKLVELGNLILGEQKEYLDWEFCEINNFQYDPAIFVCFIILESRNVTIRQIATHCRSLKAVGVAKMLESGGKVPAAVKGTEKEILCDITSSDKDSILLVTRNMTNEKSLPLALELWPEHKWTLDDLTDMPKQRVISLILSDEFHPVSWIKLAQALRNINCEQASKEVIARRTHMHN